MAVHNLPPQAFPIPLLREGDRLTSEEFIRRWEAMPELKCAELIDGIVYMSSPLSLPHGRFDFRLQSWLSHYVDATPGCDACGNTTWLMAEGQVPQPDIALQILPEYGGQSSVQGKYAAGAPELIVEVSESSASRDLNEKLRLYERSGVREYITVLPTKQQLIWRELADGRYHEMAPGPDGWWRSRVFPGLWLDPVALWNNDRSGLAAAVQRGCATEEHAAFLRQLNDNR